ncbi:hypothetical protein J2S34_003031 [Nitrobacter winogradskyi]|uniref:Uncharacterized protein n=1 Tax=Nitrobacter winogradskyi TaxID=913 RepID=A0ACC6AM89_NITWI|nr:hypothetical protein [Nitrobacter winogradskyi]
MSLQQQVRERIAAAGNTTSARRPGQLADATERGNNFMVLFSLPLPFQSHMPTSPLSRLDTKRRSCGARNPHINP